MIFQILKSGVLNVAQKGKYETHVKPRLKEIAEWYEFYTEGQIAKKLGITQRTFTSYKKDHAELQEALISGRDALITDLKKTMKQKAKGFTYTETKRTIREIDGKRTVLIEEFERYAQPDTGAIHLLLKNLDETWRNDDKATMDIKRGQLELAREKEENKW